MALYEYSCIQCGVTFEVMHKMNESPVIKHTCGGEAVKQFSTTALRFVGPGFYATDYKDK